MKKVYWVLIIGASTSLGFKFHDWFAGRPAASSSQQISAPSTTTSASESGDLKPQGQAKQIAKKSTGFESGITNHLSEGAQPKKTLSLPASRSIEEQKSLDTAMAKKALNHPDPNMRFKALVQFHNNTEAVTLESLGQIIQGDTSENVRLAALRFAASYPQADMEQLRGVFNIALNDPNEGIRNEAHDFLNQMDENAALVSKDDQPDPQQNQIGTSPL